MTPVQFASVPKLFPGETIAILAGGPSLTQADVDACRGRVRVIAIKDAIRLAPWADVFYACDGKFWKHYRDSFGFTGPRYALESDAAPWASVLRNTGDTGLELKPDGLRTGRNSGYQCVNLAYHLGATRVILLGFDMKQARGGRDHWFGSHPYPHSTPPYEAFLRCFPTIVEPLKAAGVEVINCTPGSALKCFGMMPIAEALAMQEAHA
jgi:hypothetical protein